GAYLSTLSRLPGPVVADMLCYLRIHLELSLRAKGILIAREAGVELPIDDEVRADFKEMRFLERSIGKTGKMAILPFLRSGSRDRFTNPATPKKRAQTWPREFCSWKTTKTWRSRSPCVLRARDSTCDPWTPRPAESRRSTCSSRISFSSISWCRREEASPS